MEYAHEIAAQFRRRTTPVRLPARFPSGADFR
jgi:hypothetical protein